MLLEALALTLAPPIENWIDEKFKDPDSVRIKELRPAYRGQWDVQMPEQEVEFYCYKINATNSYGGYTGYESYLFVVADGEVKQAHSGSMFDILRERCKKE